ncbi:MAG: YceI family protein [Myxococcota bacterium]
MRHVLVLFCVLLAVLPAVASDEEPPGEIRFQARNGIVRADGRFHRWHLGRVVIDEASPGESVVEVVVDLASVDTGIERRDAHLRTDDFFDVETWPEATAVLRGFRVEDPERPERWTADVTLDLHGVKREFPMHFTLVDASVRRIEGRTTLLRTDYGIGDPVSRWNPLSVRDEVEVEVEAIVPPAGRSEPPQDMPVESRFSTGR